MKFRTVFETFSAIRIFHRISPISERYGYDNAYNYEQQRGDLGKHPFATSGNIVSKAVSK